MKQLSQSAFLDGLPALVRPQLPQYLRSFESKRPWGSLLKLHYGEPRLHYEVSRVSARAGRGFDGWELGFHCEARDHHLNRLLLDGFRRHLFEIKSTLGEGIEAEMWDRGWTKIYEVIEEETCTASYQVVIAGRLAEFICCLHPIFVEIRQNAMRVHR